MSWEPVPLDVAEWMGMDDDFLRVAQLLETTPDPCVAMAASEVNAA